MQCRAPRNASGPEAREPRIEHESYGASIHPGGTGGRPRTGPCRAARKRARGGARSVGGDGDEGEQGRQQDIAGDDEGEDEHGDGILGFEDREASLTATLLAGS
jgi:hypothetical protein